LQDLWLQPNHTPQATSQGSRAFDIHTTTLGHTVRKQAYDPYVPMPHDVFFYSSAGKVMAVPWCFNHQNEIDSNYTLTVEKQSQPVLINSIRVHAHFRTACSSNVTVNSDVFLVTRQPLLQSTNCYKMLVMLAGMQESGGIAPPALSKARKCRMVLAVVIKRNAAGNYKKLVHSCPVRKIRIPLAYRNADNRKRCFHTAHTKVNKIIPLHFFINIKNLP